MKNLNQLLKHIEFKKIIGSRDINISSLHFDSRTCEKGTLFFALKGEKLDGHDFIPAALKRKSSAIICEALPSDIRPNITYLQVSDARKALAGAANFWYDFPSDAINITGVTGTNGKTTITYLLKAIYENAGFKSGIIGTTGYNNGVQFKNTQHTTPEPLELYRILRELADNGVEYAAMEVSSHALMQGRVNGINFDGAIFTNLTREHLDYHKTMDEYALAKKKLFQMLGKETIALAGSDNDYTKVMLQGIDSEIKCTAGRAESSFISILDEKLKMDSSEFVLDFTHCPHSLTEEVMLKTPLIGRFNIENAALAASYAILDGIDKLDVIKGIRSSTGAPGRMQRINLKNGAIGIVDYAHSPDALEKALKTCREILENSANSGRLILVFGCGGDRDKGKRPIMGRIAGEIADFVVITDDNPRTERPERIIDEIYRGISSEDKHKIKFVNARADAIYFTGEFSQKGDIILVAGKGHETYQIIGTEKTHFDDLEELSKFC